LGAGLCFASCQLPHAQEFSISMADRVFADLATDVLVFDWWVRNDDRKLTPLGGNPNLLWDVRANLSANGYTQVPQLSTGYPMDPEAVYDLSK
jgi:hypothetical protein